MNVSAVTQNDSATSLDGAHLARLCKALGHPLRLEIIHHLQGVEGCLCGELVTLLPVAQSTVSQHLKILKEAGLIQGSVEGPRVCYCLDHEMLARFKYAINGL